MTRVRASPARFTRTRVPVSDSFARPRWPRPRRRPSSGPPRRRRGSGRGSHSVRNSRALSDRAAPASRSRRRRPPSGYRRARSAQTTVAPCTRLRQDARDAPTEQQQPEDGHGKHADEHPDPESASLSATNSGHGLARLYWSLNPDCSFMTVLAGRNQKVHRSTAVDEHRSCLPAAGAESV